MAATGFEVYVEVGRKRAFACAVDWPGWCRSGRDEASALSALVAYAPRYAHALESVGLVPPIPRAASELVVVARLEGDASTDFGAPGAIPPADARPIDGAEVERLQSILRASWQALDAAAAAAEGGELRKGPRGGGRDVEAIVEHVLGGERSYLARLGRNPKLSGSTDPTEAASLVRRASLDAVAAASRGELPERGPRGGTIWPARYFVRRAVWHVLDHAWEIEDRRE